MDRRRSERYLLQVRVMFSWTDAHGSYREEQGISRDISSRGEFVIADKCPEEGAAVSLKILLPRTSAASRSLRIQAQGTVVRVEAIDGNSGIGFAVRNRRNGLAACGAVS